jgi:hypothetical protein
VQQVEPFLPRRRVPRVVEVHQHGVEVARFERREDARGRLRGLDLVLLRFEEQAERLENVLLIVGDEDARFSGAHAWGDYLSAIGYQRSAADY